MKAESVYTYDQLCAAVRKTIVKAAPGTDRDAAGIAESTADHEGRMAHLALDVLARIKPVSQVYVAKLLTGKTPEEQMAFWQRRTEALLSKQLKVKSQSLKVSPEKAINADA